MVSEQVPIALSLMDNLSFLPDFVDLADHDFTIFFRLVLSFSISGSFIESSLSAESLKLLVKHGFSAGHLSGESYQQFRQCAYFLYSFSL
jgi:hypothetical protein